jgi:bis(5'-nucleosyl)-tetraphosphatase (symmetrical)
MATWAIGDVQGCFATLTRLLARIKFSDEDRVWLLGDLVNRGPASLAVLRWARSLGDRARAVLGNHDVHLLARADGSAGPKRRDTLDEVLRAPDRDALLDWLRMQPFVHRTQNRLLVHAGLLPAWSADDAEREARAAEEALRARRPLPPSVRAFTRLRTVYPDGRMNDEFSGPPGDAPERCVPWFAHPQRRSSDATVIFGHWAALGVHVSPTAIGLDSGCVWGHGLTALDLDGGALVSEPTAAADRRG